VITRAECDRIVDTLGQALAAVDPGWLIHHGGTEDTEIRFHQWDSEAADGAKSVIPAKAWRKPESVAAMGRGFRGRQEIGKVHFWQPLRRDDNQLASQTASKRIEIRLSVLPMSPWRDQTGVKIATFNVNGFIGRLPVLL
jgi:hypothetical protein